MKKNEYKSPGMSVHEIVVAQVIAQSYGDKGHAGPPINENEIPGW